MRRLILALIALAPVAAGQSAVDRAYESFYNLDFDQAIEQFQRAIALDPKSPDLHNHLAQTIVFREMYRNGALESELWSGNDSLLRRPRLNPSAQTEKWFLDEVAAAMALSNARTAANPNDAAALYSLGISYGLRADYYWVVRKSWRDSLKDATSARRLHNRVSELQPGNLDARLVQGLHDYIVGSLPWTYRMLGFLVGIRGDKIKGIRTIESVANHGRNNRLEAQIFLCALYRRENQPGKAIPLIQDLIRRYPRNFLFRLELSQMYSRAGDAKSGLLAVQELAALKSKGAAGFDRLPWEKIYYQEGTIQFWYRSFDQALENMQKVARAGEALDLNTGATAWLRIGQIYDLTGRRGLAIDAYRKAISYAPEAEAAREARAYLSSPYRRS